MVNPGSNSRTKKGAPQKNKKSDQKNTIKIDKIENISDIECDDDAVYLECENLPDALLLKIPENDEGLAEDLVLDECCKSYLEIGANREKQDAFQRYIEKNIKDEDEDIEDPIASRRGASAKSLTPNKILKKIKAIEREIYALKNPKITSFLPKRCPSSNALVAFEILCQFVYFNNNQGLTYNDKQEFQL